ncbi:MAG: RNA methyltransferase [Lachnospiraceae bacterium]|nr:RNA methyltransferase [Lachnospiraceae bacterium]
MITSQANAKVKQIIRLQKKGRERRRQDCFLVEGIRMFREAPPELVKEIYLSKSFRQNAEWMREFKEHLWAIEAVTGKEVCAELVEDWVFAQMSDTKTPQGILCVLSMPHYDLEARLAAADGTWVILEDLQDPGNLGTILRTAEGAGIEGVIMTENTVDIYNPKTIRSTMGSLYRVPFFVTEDIRKVLQKLKEQDFAVYAAHLDGKSCYDTFSYTGKCAFLIGNEGNGLKESTAALATDYVKIPMEGSVESLNAAIAASLLMYEAYRQRRSSGCERK